jgi:hypothetical protein
MSCNNEYNIKLREIAQKMTSAMKNSINMLWLMIP